MSDRLEDVVDIALRVAEALEKVGASYFLGGSLASSIDGEPRATNDIDFVIDMAVGKVRELSELLGADFEVDGDMLRDAILHGRSANVHIPETSGQGFRFDVGAHSGVTWAHIPGTWAARTRPVLTRRKRWGDRGRRRGMPGGTVAEWNVTPCAESKKFSDCISTAT